MLSFCPQEEIVSLVHYGTGPSAIWGFNEAERGLDDTSLPISCPHHFSDACDASAELLMRHDWAHAVSSDETVCRTHAQMSEWHLYNYAFLSYNITDLILLMWACILITGTFDYMKCKLWLITLHVTQMHPSYKFFGYMHACIWSYFQLHLTNFTMLINILQIFPVKMQLKCVFALVTRAQTAHNLITGLDLKFTIMISLLMVSSYGFYSM